MKTGCQIVILFVWICEYGASWYSVKSHDNPALHRVCVTIVALLFLWHSERIPEFCHWLGT
jgi:hypothetical protein